MFMNTVYGVFGMVIRPMLYNTHLKFLLSESRGVCLFIIYNVHYTGPFNNTIGDLSHKYDTGITPSDATFAIWGKL